MLRFKLDQIRLEERFYILLPKLNSSQVDILRRRLVEVGYRVSVGDVLRAEKGRSTITISQVGLCWSNDDLIDAIAPVLPEVIASEKEKTSVEELQSKYFRIKLTGEGTLLRFSPRMESSTIWESLRSTGQCGLSPDEHTLTRFVLSQTAGDCVVLTDYPTESSVVRRIGRKQYYESNIRASEVAGDLRSCEGRGVRNAYLPKNALLRFTSPLDFTPEKAAKIFSELGDWCSFSSSS